MSTSLSENLPKTAAYSAVLFGVVTIVSGARVLFGADPGYVVYLPLLLFNTIMGAAYVLVGILALKNLRLGVHGAALICALNLIVLGVILYKQPQNDAIAEESVAAMMFRAAVWLALFLIFASANQRNSKRNAA